PKKKDTQVPQSSVPNDNVADEAVYKKLDNSLVKATTTASSLEAEHDNGGGPRCQETMGDTIAQTRFENVSKLSNDLLLARGNTLRSGEDSLKLNEMMELYTNLQQRVLDLETTKTTQSNEITSLKMRVKKLEKKDRSRTHMLKRLYKVGLSTRVEFFRDKEDLVNDDNEIFDVNALAGEEVFVAKQSGNVVEEVVAMIDAASTIPVSAAIITDAKVKADYQLAQRLQAQEQEELTNEEKARLFAEIELEENLKKAEAEVMKGSSKRAGTELEQEVTKKQKVDDVQETTYYMDPSPKGLASPHNQVGSSPEGNGIQSLEVNWDQQVVEVSSDEEDFSDEGLFGDEYVVLFNDVNYSLTDTEIKMFKETPTTSRSPIASTSTTSRSIVPIASTSNAQVASTAPRGYKKIAMTGCVLGLRAPNDPNAPPPSTIRKRKP
ncbi:hypothetical protein Tco_1064917, partial [Tanacetum coccineum]